MTIRFFVNFALLAIPIAATLGILFGIQTHRQATGQTPLFAPKPLHGITKTRYCQKAFGIHPKSKGQEYTRKFLGGRNSSELRTSKDYRTQRKGRQAGDEEVLVQLDHGTWALRRISIPRAEVERQRGSRRRMGKTNTTICDVVISSRCLLLILVFPARLPTTPPLESSFQRCC